MHLQVQLFVINLMKNLQSICVLLPETHIIAICLIVYSVKGFGKVDGYQIDLDIF